MLSRNNDSAPPDNFTLREIQPGDHVAGLSLGEPRFSPLKTFLKRDALHYHQCNIAKSYVLVAAAEKPTVVAYISLMCSDIALEAQYHPEDVEAYRYRDFPAVKIVRLAVDRRIQGNDVGRSLVQFAIGVAKDQVMPAVGCRFVVVDSKPSAIPFYTRCGFTLLDTPQNKAAEHPLLYIDLNYIE